MTIKTFLAEAWMQLAGAGMLILAAIMMLTPFFVSLIANLGRRPVSTVYRHATRARLLAAPRRALS